MVTHGFTVLFCVLAIAACSAQNLINEFISEEIETEPLWEFEANDVKLCGGAFTESEGTISSPGYPHHLYPSNANCLWQIDVEEGKVIMMKFIFMDIEVGLPLCPFDGVIIIDRLESWDDDTPLRLDGHLVPGITAPQKPPVTLGRYCGQKKFDPFVSETNGVRITFYSDGDSAGAGFALSWKAVDAPRSQPSSVLQACDFDEGLCPGWKNVETKEDSFDWSINSGETKTENTGPTFDHTKNNAAGKYAYVEASAPQVENDTALLSSPELAFAEGENEYCLEFWYHMFGQGIGSLVVGVASGETRAIKWMKSGNQGNKWLRKTVPITRVEKLFKVIFAGVRSTGYAGDIAIDDIKIYGKPCANVTWKDRFVGNNGSDTDDYKPCENEREYPCMDSSVCITDEKMCDGEFDCPQKDDESEFFCTTDATTAVPPPPEETTDLFESTVFTETAMDLTSHSATTEPEWTWNVTTFVLETTPNEDGKTDVTTTSKEATKQPDEIFDFMTVATTKLADSTQHIEVESTAEEKRATTESKPHEVTQKSLTTSGRYFRTTIGATTTPTERIISKTDATREISVSPTTTTVKTTPYVAIETSPEQKNPSPEGTSPVEPITTAIVRSSTKSIITAIIIGPSVAEKQIDNDGSSARIASSKYALFIYLLGILLQYFWNGP